MKLTQEQLAALIAKVFANLNAKFTADGKSRHHDRRYSR